MEAATRARILVGLLSIGLSIGLAACTGEIVDHDPLDPGPGDGSGTGDDDDDSTANPWDIDVHGDDAEPPPVVNGPMVSFDFEESDETILNPERGFYFNYNLVNASETAALALRDNGYSLAISVVRLDAYRTSALPQSFLDALNEGFDEVRDAGAKIILRFSYNASFSADASREQIEEHLQQLEPVLQANADVIAVMQAGFIGAWGEWHSSTNGLDNDEDRAAILDALLDALPSSRAVQVRRPIFKEAAYPGGPLEASEAYTGTARARLGHHNDCFLASATDYGTYDSPVDEWEAYVGTDGLYNANGGETCAVYEPRSDCEHAVDIMAANHWSYLNIEYNQDVIGSWEDDGCDEEIRQRLGHRFTLQRSAHDESIAPGGELGVEIDIYNSGFASPYNLRPVDIVLTNGTERHVARLAGVDARRWAAGSVSTIAAKLRVPADLAPGTWSLALRLPDAASSLAGDPRYAIRMANDGVWDADTGDNIVSTQLVVDASAPGPVDSSALDFVEIP